MVRVGRLAFFAFVGIGSASWLGCGSSTSDGDSDGAGGNDVTSGAGTTKSGAGSTGSGASPLSDHELYLVGVWRGTISATDQEYTYFVLNEDRTGCGWDRHGDNFGQRFYGWTFTEWRLEETPLDADGRMTIRLRSEDGTEQTIERYDPETDHVFVGGLTSTTWLDLLIPCESAGSNATQTDVMRRGLKP